MAFKREISKRQMGFLGTLFRQKADARFLGRSRVFSLALVLIVGTNAAQSSQLNMVGTDGCEWCEVLNQQITPIYQKTAGGRFVPLWWVDLYDKFPPDLSRIRGVAFSPTLVVMHHGKEAERIFGYSGDAFFWGLARRDIEKIGFLDPVGHPTN